MGRELTGRLVTCSGFILHGHPDCLTTLVFSCSKEKTSVLEIGAETHGPQGS